MDEAPRMGYIEDLASLVTVQTESTVSRTVMREAGVRVVVFAFDAGQELTEHTAAMPVLLTVLDGHLRITAGGETVDLKPGGVVYLPARLPHAVEALQASRMALTMLDQRAPK